MGHSLTHAFQYTTLTLTLKSRINSNTSLTRISEHKPQLTIIKSSVQDDRTELQHSLKALHILIKAPVRQMKLQTIASMPAKKQKNFKVSSLQRELQLIQKSMRKKITYANHRLVQAGSKHMYMCVWLVHLNLPHA